MKLTARLALSQLKVNRRRAIWTCLGIVLSTAMLTTIYSLGFGTGMKWIDQMIFHSDLRDVYLAFISGLATVMSIFVISISIIVISNAFRVSASERLSQFGILKSTGATKSQIMQTVVYEGLFLTIIGIPIGVIIGLLVQFISVDMINRVIEPMLSVEDLASGNHMMVFVFSWFAFWLSVSVSLLTVFLSAWLPAKKASEVPAINAIRGIGEVVIKNKKIRGGEVVKKIFKTEGVLARTFLKRSKKNFRATVIAMSFSVAIFIIAGSFYSQMMHFAEVQWGEANANVMFSVNVESSREVDCDEYGEETPGFYSWSWGEFIDGAWTERTCRLAVELSEVVRSVDEFNELHQMLEGILNEGDSLVGRAGMGWHTRQLVMVHESELTADFQKVREDSGFVVRDEMHELTVELIVVDDAFAEILADLAGVPVGSNILLNHGRQWFEDGRVIEFEMLDFNYQTLTISSWDDERERRIDNSEMELELHGQITAANRPSQLESLGNWGFRVIVPAANMEIMQMDWFIQTDESARVVEDGRELIFDYFGEGNVGLWAQDRDAEEAMTRNTIGLVMFFIFGFVGVLILIGLTNVVSTISENVKTRSKEFAVLQSVGMTSGGIKRMLNLESVFSSARALVIGVPLGILGSYGVYHAMSNMIYLRFSIPWLWLVVSVVAVFVTTWSTMRYAAGRLKKQNIIETIRSGSGM